MEASNGQVRDPPLILTDDVREQLQRRGEGNGFTSRRRGCLAVV